jgi:signal transduction histidine kinase
MAEVPAQTVLTVDDNDAIRYSLTRYLRDGGYHVIEARTGAEALNLARHNPALITLDINLPDLDGFEVCRRLKEDPATCEIPVLHISASCVDSVHKVRGLEGGADAYLSEPIDRQELLATVKALLRMRQAQKEARRKADEAEAAKQELSRANESLESRVRERTAELKAANENLRELSARLLQLQDEERRRFARELHDSVGQMLTAITLNIATLRSLPLAEEAAKAAEENQDLVQQVISEIRTISHLLHPPLLDEVGLTSAVRWFVEEFSERSKITVELEIEDEFGRLPREMEIAIFRIVQECLTNVHRHSGSRSAQVRIAYGQGEICVTVKDEGKGIPADVQESLKSTGKMGVGFRGMRERIAQLGGRLELQSGNGGTVVTCTMPTQILSVVRPAGLIA